MSGLWWLQPGWTETLCSRCGKKIWPEGDPDHGVCYGCFFEDSQPEERFPEEEYPEMPPIPEED